jgi:hypothetical protein
MPGMGRARFNFTLKSVCMKKRIGFFVALAVMLFCAAGRGFCKPHGRMGIRGYAVSRQ